MHLDLTLTLETPFLPGSADPNKVDPDWPLRPSEVKGIWRWWARALVAGALFDVGLLHGTNDTNKPYVKIPTRDEAMCISRMVGDVLGLGYAGSRQSKASCFKIFINPDTTIVRSTDEVYQYSNLQRIKLLTLGKRKFEIVSEASIKLVIEDRVGCDLSKEQMELGMRALALALKLSCFGKGGRRGLGCFSVSAQGDYADLFNKPTEDLIKDSIEAIRKITKETQQCENLWRKNINECELPPMPVLSTGMNYVKCINKKNIQDKLLSYKLRLTPYLLLRVQGRNLLNTLNTLHNFFLRSARARTLKGYGSAEDDLRVNLEAWVLGLPREQKGTGYMLKDVNISRRASPMIVAVHEKEAYISIFTSADWPSKLTWKGRGKPIEKPINEIEIIDAMAIAINELTEYLSKQGIRWSSWS